MCVVPPLPPEVQAAAVELNRLGYVSVEPGWAAITLGIVRAVAAVSPELVPRFTSKWASMQVTFHPEDLAAALRIRLAGAVVLSKTSQVTCQNCGRAGTRSTGSAREIVKAPCTEPRATANMTPLSIIRAIGNLSKPQP